MPIIKDIKAILTAPDGINLIVVKVSTDQEGLYGLGCSTFAYRELAVKSVIEDYLRPLLFNRDVRNIEDLWHVMVNNAYWRNDAISNNAISGVDMALWDIKGKMANLPLYDLFGGKSREGVPFYRHVNGSSLDQIVERIEAFKKEHVRHIRIQWGLYGGIAQKMNKPLHAQPGSYISPTHYILDTITMFDHVRKVCGDDVELIHDIHERLTPADAIYLAKQLEKYRLFFLEDPLPPEQVEWMKNLKSQCATPIGIGELFNNPKEWEYLIKNRLIDFIRIHLSQIGGLTPARKLAYFAEQFGIRTAWHGPGDVSPVGHAANVHLSLHTHNTGILEWCGFSDLMYQVFPGMPYAKDGYLYVSNKPGLGIDINEELAKKYPIKTEVTTWTQTRLPDGTLVNP
ncbi:MAG TPA: enolase C-terminal domain-like protein [Acholeplasmataceae bacterium]|mgnify:CR=1 FL=1|nr:enolase C-terminal domain-like protein [Acholeplasmataceae bacterium]